MRIGRIALLRDWLSQRRRDAEFFWGEAWGNDRFFNHKVHKGVHKVHEEIPLCPLRKTLCPLWLKNRKAFRAMTDFLDRIYRIDLLWFILAETQRRKGMGKF